MTVPESTDARQLRREFAERLRVAIEGAGVRQPHRVLADELHVTRQTIQNWLAGQSTPRAEHLQRLARYLDVRAAWLRDGEWPPSPAPEPAAGVSGAPGLSEEDAAWLMAVRKLPARQRRALWEIVTTMNRAGEDP